ncbi:hypothetical protein AAF712_015903, partial [Marasmius tenuissimus]
MVDPPPLAPTLTVPPLPTFAPTPTSPSYKALPYEAAQWTFTSNELQDIVSRAIRCSARESFVRLLSLKLLDTILPDELSRLSDQRLSTTGKYRWTVQRRSMLMQGLWAVVVLNTGTGAGSSSVDMGPAATSLLTQLSDVVSDCDRMVEELVGVGDQVREIGGLVDNHWASALAVALRKLNTSYAKRTSELLSTRDRITQLEAERDDAWKEAEKVAKQLDHTEQEYKKVVSELEASHEENKKIRSNLAFKDVEFKGVVGELARERRVSTNSIKEVERRKWAENEVERLKGVEEELERVKKELERVEDELKEAKERVSRVKLRSRSISRTRNKEEDLEQEKREWEAAVEARAKQEAQATKHRTLATATLVPVPIPSSVSIPPLSPVSTISPISPVGPGSLTRSSTFGSQPPLPPLPQQRASVGTFGQRATSSGNRLSGGEIVEEPESIEPPPPAHDANSDTDSDSDSDSDSILGSGEEILIQTAEVVSVHSPISPRASFSSFHALSQFSSTTQTTKDGRPMSPTVGVEKPKLVTLPSSPILQTQGMGLTLRRGVSVPMLSSNSTVLPGKQTGTPVGTPGMGSFISTPDKIKPPPQAPTPESVHGHEYDDGDEPAVDSDTEAEEAEYQALLNMDVPHSDGAEVAKVEKARVEKMGPFRLSLPSATQRISTASPTTTTNPPPHPPPTHPPPDPPRLDFPVPPSSSSPQQLTLAVPGSPMSASFPRRSKRYSGTTGARTPSPLVTTFAEAASVPREDEDEHGEGDEEERTTPTQTTPTKRSPTLAFPRSRTASQPTGTRTALPVPPVSPSKRTYLEGVTAARKRSIRASQGALRLPYAASASSSPPIPPTPSPTTHTTVTGPGAKLYLHTNLN